MDLKRTAYDQYVSTHLRSRKGDSSLESFAAKRRDWERNYGPLIPRNKEIRIVDLGCGDGAIVWWLQSKGYENSEGIDISQEQVDVAARLGVKNITMSDISTFLNNRDEDYDVMIMRDVAEHFNREQIQGILALCRKALKPNGTIIIQVPNAMSPFFGSIRYGDITHETAYVPSSLSQILSVAGFSEIRFYSVQPIPRSIMSLLRYCLWKVVEAFYRLLLFAELGKGKRIVTQTLIAVSRKAC